MFYERLSVNSDEVPVFSGANLDLGKRQPEKVTHEVQQARDEVDMYKRFLAEARADRAELDNGKALDPRTYESQAGIADQQVAYQEASLAQAQALLDQLEAGNLPDTLAA